MNTKKTEIMKLLDICMDDKYREMRKLGVKVSLPKRLNLDLTAKILFLFINSIGMKKKGEIAFVDEVRNKSMMGNLYNTINHCSKEFGIIRIRDIERDPRNIKMGYTWPIFHFFYVMVISFGIILLLPIRGEKRTTTSLAHKYIEEINNYIDRICDQGYRIVYSMTDHHFFSTIICAHSRVFSNVLQHGIIKDITYYTPVTADRFLAWGNHSSELLNDSRVMVSGTYKFDGMNIKTDNESNTILFCISHHDKILIENKIKALISICDSIGYSLKVLNHPGSFYDDLEIDKSFPNIEVMKEVPISTIDFSLAVTENSTIIVDLVYMGKPFIIYDDYLDYYSIYPGIPMSNSVEELRKMIIKYREFNYESLNAEIISNELNNNYCCIFDKE